MFIEGCPGFRSGFRSRDARDVGTPFLEGSCWTMSFKAPVPSRWTGTAVRGNSPPEVIQCPCKIKVNRNYFPSVLFLLSPPLKKKEAFSGYPLMGYASPEVLSSPLRSPCSSCPKHCHWQHPQQQPNQRPIRGQKPALTLRHGLPVTKMETYKCLKRVERCTWWLMIEIS